MRIHTATRVSGIVRTTVGSRLLSRSAAPAALALAGRPQRSCLLSVSGGRRRSLASRRCRWLELLSRCLAVVCISRQRLRGVPQVYLRFSTIVLRRITFPLDQILQLARSPTTLFKAVVDDAFRIIDEVSVKFVKVQGVGTCVRCTPVIQQRHMENRVSRQPLEI